MQVIADLLTAARVVLAILFPLAGLAYGEAALPFVIVGIIFGWTTDILDGYLARLAASEQVTWWGKHDFGIDMLMIFGSFLYMTEIGVVPWWLAVLYSTLGGAIVYRFRSEAVTMLLAFPLSALPLVVALYRAPLFGRIFLLWIVITLVLDWPRFKGVVGEFIKDMSEVISAERRTLIRKYSGEKRHH